MEKGQWVSSRMPPIFSQSRVAVSSGQYSCVQHIGYRQHCGNFPIVQPGLRMPRPNVGNLVPGSAAFFNSIDGLRRTPRWRRLPRTAAWRTVAREAALSEQPKRPSHGRVASLGQGRPSGSQAALRGELPGLRDGTYRGDELKACALKACALNTCARFDACARPEPCVSGGRDPLRGRTAEHEDARSWRWRRRRPRRRWLWTSTTLALHYYYKSNR